MVKAVSLRKDYQGGFLRKLKIYSPSEYKKAHFLRGQENGKCIAPVPKSNDRPVTLANPTGGNRSFNFAIRIDQQPRVPVDHEEPLLISDLAIKETHFVQIFRDGKPFASFRFRFEDYKSKELCLWFKALYETWSLWENTPSVGCKCSR